MTVNNAMTEMMQALEQGDLALIDQLLETFLVKELPEEIYALAEIFMQYGYMKEADRVLEHLQFLFPEEAQLKIDRANVLMELGDEDEALNLLLEIEEASPEYPQALLVLADYYQMQGLFEVAEIRINEALAILPDEPLLHFAKAELLFETGRFLEAARLYEELYEQQAEFAGIHLVERLAEVYRAGAAYETALDYYLKALEDEVKPDILFGAAYSAFQSQKYEMAIKQLEELKELDPDYFSAYLLLAESYAMTGENQKAYAAIQEGLKRDEYDKTLYLFAGKMALKNSLPVDAEQYLREAIALDPEYMEAVLALISVLGQQERNEDVIELFETLQQNDFEWSTLYPFAAEAYENLELYDRAYEFYRLAYNDFKEDATFLEKYVYFLLEEGKRSEAKVVLEQLMNIQPGEPEWQEKLEALEFE
ncbi:tetratricopeptide repeat protein [Lysinibacillus fusiformis]|uniref:tetratricopeptide repeat protein n=1 Tax=Lysinibacillus fusiformis TaxID=28031 RepID=UPI00263AF90C|nr:tetratricopeptide repeat protein [Lysinibacillus fusiformis]MDC6269068.1 tetratricopeptide repeat protein [Lysinibacillus sphaericus]MDN4969862.1 tetratricopeptide repeat protein [Lysinibacillus fusiformis]